VGLQLARTIESRSTELRITVDLARSWQSEGRGREAHQLLVPIYDWFTKGFDTKDLNDAKALLNELA
jgi:predicted ATPase